MGELRVLVTIRRDELGDPLREAREDGGDLADNAGLADAMESSSGSSGASTLEGILGRARIVAPPRDGTAGIGTRVRVCRPGTEPLGYELVGALEADARNRRVSITSPVGRALLGRRAGAIVDVEAPGGSRRLEILAVDEVPSGTTAP